MHGPTNIKWKKLLGLARRMEAVSLSSYNLLLLFPGKILSSSNRRNWARLSYLPTDRSRSNLLIVFLNHSETIMNVESMCQFTRFEVLRAVLLNVQVFWNVTPWLREQITPRYNITSQMNEIFMCYFNNTSFSKILGLFGVNKYVSKIKENYIKNCSNVKLVD
jgi:hypothetical protein